MKRAVESVYVYSLTQHASPRTLDQIAVRLRPGKVLYESLESAAFHWGLFSQGVYTSTCVTDGMAGRLETPYGSVELIHSPEARTSLGETVDRGFDRCAPLATKRRTFEDMISLSRSVGILAEQYMKDVSGIDSTTHYATVEDNDTCDFEATVKIA